MDEIVRSGRPDAKHMRDDWNAYWAGNDHVRVERSAYDRIAQFYRNWLIRPTLNRVIKGAFPPGARLLHAGCGGGAVDADLVNYARITALDISPKAIALYERNNPAKAETVVGDIFALTAMGRTFDGIYNLGVMEHFSEDQIVLILRQFNLCLNSGSKIVLLWPPVYGLSVFALHVAHYVLNRILKRNVELHPPEPTKVQSRAQVERLLERAGFKLVKMSFGPSDAFTHAIITAEKR